MPMSQCCGIASISRAKRAPDQHSANQDRNANRILDRRNLTPETIPGGKSEPGFMEKAKQAIGSVTGGTAGIKEKAGQAVESVKGGTAGIREKAGQAIERVTGRSAGTEEEGTPQMRPAEM